MKTNKTKILESTSDAILNMVVREVLTEQLIMAGISICDLKVLALQKDYDFTVTI